MPGNSMNVIIFNRNQLPQRYKFKKAYRGYGKIKNTEFNLPKATSKQLRDIAKRIKEERQVRMIKVVITTIILFLGLIALFVYSANGLSQLLTY